MKRLQRSFTVLLVVVTLLLFCGCNFEAPEAAPDSAAAAADLEPGDSEPEEAKADILNWLPPSYHPLFKKFHTLTSGEMHIYEAASAMENGSVQRRVYEMPDGGLVAMGRAEAGGGEILLDSWTANSPSGTIRYFDGGGNWVEAPLDEGQYQAATIEITMEDGSNFFLYTPKAYAFVEPGTLEYLPACGGVLQAARTEDGWAFSLRLAGPEDGYLCDYTLARTQAPLLDWIRENCPDTWMNYTQDGAGKWCFDGYYRTTPSSYTPTGENMVYRCPASYVVRSLALAGVENATAEALSLAMLETLTRNQTEYGCWLTEPESQWLSSAYQVGPGFYDTRFNSDLMEIYTEVYARLGGDFLQEAMTRYADFYLNFAEAHHTETENGGWFVEDYWNPDGNQPIHTSLNHQLAECLTLYHLADALDRQELREAAQRMLLAVEDTASSWIKKNHDLYYRIQPDGTYYGTDYPYLTYNDLYDLQAYLTESGAPSSEALDQLMQAKKQWMDANHITEYKQPLEVDGP